MRILIVSYFFSPFNVIGAVRVTKLAEYWASNGHDVLVLSAKNQPLPKELSTKFPKKHVVYTNWININYLPERIKPAATHKVVSETTFAWMLGSRV